MLRVELSHAKPGMKLALSVKHPQMPRHTLLKVDYELEAESITSMRRCGVQYVWVAYPSLDFIREFIDQHVLSAHHEVVGCICDTFKSIQRDTSANLPYAKYTHAVGNLVSSLIENPQAALFLDGLFESGDDELMAHSSAVTYLSLLMGLKLAGYLVRQRKRVEPVRATQVTSLGLGAMFHDIGVTLLDEDVRRRFMASGDEYDEQYQQHVALGYELVQGKIEPSAATVVLNHHQRCDASGYAGAGRPVLDGQRIHVFARIAGLADAFDRLRRPVNAQPRPTVHALASLLDERVLTGFDPQVVRALLAVVPPYPPGSTVKLNDGRWAVSISHHVEDPCRPIVQVIPDPATLAANDITPGEQIDLAEAAPASLRITHCDGEHVDSMNFTTPSLQRPGFVEVALS